MVGQEQHTDAFPDRFLGRVAEESLCALIPAQDRSIEVRTDDAVVRGFDKGREKARVSSACLRAVQS